MLRSWSISAGLNSAFLQKRRLEPSRCTRSNRITKPIMNTIESKANCCGIVLLRFFIMHQTTGVGAVLKVGPGRGIITDRMNRSERSDDIQLLAAGQSSKAQARHFTRAPKSLRGQA